MSTNIVVSIISWLTSRNKKAPTDPEAVRAVDFLAQMVTESSRHADAVSAALVNLPGSAGMTFITTVELVSCGNAKVALYSSQLSDNAGTTPIQIVDRALLSVVPGS